MKGRGIYFTAIAAVLLVIIAGGCLSFFRARHARNRLIKEIPATRYFSLLQDADDLILATEAGNSEPLVYRCLPGEPFLVPVHLTNQSAFLVTSGLDLRASNQAVNLSYQLFDEGKSLTGTPDFEGPRTSLADSLPGKISPESLTAEARVQVQVRCPHRPGKYQGFIDVVQEGLAWGFSSRKKGPGYISLQVQSSHPDTQPPTLPKSLQKYPFHLPDFSRTHLPEEQRKILQEAVHLAANTLLLALQQAEFFERKYWLAFAGSQYPVVWTRDMATIQQALLKIFGHELFFPHWSEIFLLLQSFDGEVADWVDISSPSREKIKGKNTALSDQELWTLFSIAEQWQNHSLSTAKDASLGERHSFEERVFRLLSWLLDSRWDETRGCLWSAHVADWGDVHPWGVNNTDATSYIAGQPRVCSIYSQALLYKVVTKIETFPALNSAMHNTLMFDRFGGVTKFKNDLVKFCQTNLWQEDRGFFKIHIHVDPITHAFAEDDMFALGGNILAASAGLADATQVRRILSKGLAIRQTAGAVTPSLVLFPPYPAGFFSLPNMKNPFHYQNGGLWDWHGAPFVEQLLTHGYTEGVEGLVSIAKHAVEAKTFYEWYSVTGDKGEGPNYRASAAAFLLAAYRLSENFNTK